ncbi:MAG: hypothetical protein IJ746_00085 [Ruminococcus sp.]|nr:hypothetical protein [Ruminococcus sp.]
MTKSARLIAVLAAAVLFAGCAGSENSSEGTQKEYNNTDSNISEQSNTEDSNSDPAAAESTTPVYSSDCELLGSIDLRQSTATLTPQGIVYGRMIESGEKRRMDYLLFDPEAGESRLLGSVEEFEYECGFARVQRDGHMYLLLSTGNVFSDEECTQRVLDLDLKAGTMSELYSALDPTVYGGLALVGDELFFMQRDGRQVTALDITKGTTRTVAEFSFDDPTLTGDIIRQLCADGGDLCLLRLSMRGEGDVKLFIDRYAPEGSLKESSDISALPRDPAMTEADALTELRMPVSGFWVGGREFYYENFSQGRCLAALGEGGSIEPLFDCYALTPDVGELALALQPEGEERLFFSHLFDPEGRVFCLEGGAVTELRPELPEGSWSLSQVSACGGQLLLLYSDSDNTHRDPETGEWPLQFRLYKH